MGKRKKKGKERCETKIVAVMQFDLDLSKSRKIIVERNLISCQGLWPLQVFGEFIRSCFELSEDDKSKKKKKKQRKYECICRRLGKPKMNALMYKINCHTK